MAYASTRYGRRRSNSNSEVFVVQTLGGATAEELKQEIRELRHLTKFVVDLHSLEKTNPHLENFICSMAQTFDDEVNLLVFCGPEWMEPLFKNVAANFSTATSDELSVAIKDLVSPDKLVGVPA